MSTEKMRAAFLTWWWHDDQQELRQSCAEGWALHIWLSSRVAIEIDLPPSGGEKGCFWKEDVIEVIESLGLKVKP